jgi:hypothetical protein
MMDLRKLLPSDKFDIRDFDERGVPDGGGSAWHQAETIHWLTIATQNATVGKSTIICGFNEPERVLAVHEKTHPDAELILLHASGDIIRKRLRGRYPTVKSEKEIERASGTSLGKFIESCVSYAPTLRQKFEMENCLIIDTDAKTPEEVAREITKKILDADALANEAMDRGS